MRSLETSIDQFEANIFLQDINDFTETVPTTGYYEVLRHQHQASTQVTFEQIEIGT